MAAKRPPRAQIAWSQVKEKLSNFDHAGLIALLQDLYAASKDNQAFLHSRFSLGSDPLEPYKQAIARSLRPDWNKPASIVAAKKAISGYRKADSRAEDMAELMIFFYPERAKTIERLGRVRDLCRDIGYGVFDEMTMLLEESGLGNQQ